MQDFHRLRAAPWRDASFQAPPVLQRPTSMLTFWEKRMLYWLTLEGFECRGLIIDLGAFLGSSTLCLAAGLRNGGFASPLIHSYDLFRLGPFERERFFPENPPPGLVTRQLYEANLAGFRDLVEIHEGDLLNKHWPGDPIEVLFIDIAKSHTVWDHVVSEFFPALIPGVSIVIVQDYLFDRTGPWHHVVMERFSDHFELVGDTEVNSVFFRYDGGLTPAEIEETKWQRIPGDERLALMDRAIARMDTEEKRTILAGPRQWLVDEMGGEQVDTEVAGACALAAPPDGAESHVP